MSKGKANTPWKKRTDRRHEKAFTIMSKEMQTMVHGPHLVRSLFVKEVLLGHNHAHFCVHHLRLLLTCEGQTDELQQITRSTKPKYALSYPLQKKKFATICLQQKFLSETDLSLDPWQVIWVSEFQFLPLVIGRVKWDNVCNDLNPVPTPNEHSICPRWDDCCCGNCPWHWTFRSLLVFHRIWWTQFNHLVP